MSVFEWIMQCVVSDTAFDTALCHSGYGLTWGVGNSVVFVFINGHMTSSLFAPRKDIEGFKKSLYGNLRSLVSNTKMTLRLLPGLSIREQTEWEYPCDLKQDSFKIYELDDCS